MTDRETRVQEIAYQLWLQEGRPEGRADAHWYEAEAVYDAEVAGDDLKSDPLDELALSETAVAKAESGKKRAEGASQKSGSQKSGGSAKSAELLDARQPACQ